MNKGTTNEGGAKAMEVETPQKDKEEQATNSAMKQASTNTEAKQTATAGSPNPKTMISYYEWRKRHHIWLNSLMRQAVRETDGPEIPDLANLCYLVQLEPEHHTNIEPRHQYIHHYDLRIVVADAKDPVEAYCQALTK